MEVFIGTKIVKGVPMLRGTYNRYRNWELPPNEDGADDGYLVEYVDGGKPNHEDHKGYISWSPKEQFDNAYRDVGLGVTFGDAITMLKQGKRMARQGWNGLGMFCYLVPEGVYPARTDAIKGYFVTEQVPYRAYLALKTAQNDVATWSPSVSDCLAEDWVLV